MRMLGGAGRAKPQMRHRGRPERSAQHKLGVVCATSTMSRLSDEGGGLGEGEGGSVAGGGIAASGGSREQPYGPELTALDNFSVDAFGHGDLHDFNQLIVRARVRQYLSQQMRFPDEAALVCHSLTRVQHALADAQFEDGSIATAKDLKFFRTLEVQARLQVQFEVPEDAPVTVMQGERATPGAAAASTHTTLRRGGVLAEGLSTEAEVAAVHAARGPPGVYDVQLDLAQRVAAGQRGAVAGDIKAPRITSSGEARCLHSSGP